MKTREFTEEEWRNCIGAERWPDHVQPVCRDFNGRGTVYGFADHGGIMITIHDPVDPNKFVDWWINWEIPNQALARLILDALPENVNPAEYGFNAQSSLEVGNRS